ncbi:18252_t:CDS:2, partial [Gigaspora margarita]
MLNWAEEESIAIIEITETNMVDTNKKYKGYWSSATEEKKKSSGYIIPKADGVVIGVYMLLNNKIAVKKLQQRIVEVVFKRKNQMQIAIIDDFNHIADNILDRMHSQT